MTNVANYDKKWLGTNTGHENMLGVLCKGEKNRWYEQKLSVPMSSSVISTTQR